MVSSPFRQPVIEITGVLFMLSLDTQFGTGEGRADLGNQLLKCIGRFKHLEDFGLLVEAIKAGFMAGAVYLMPISA